MISRKQWFISWIKKLLGIKSPSIYEMTGGKFKYRYDYYRMLYKKPKKKKGL